MVNKDYYQRLKIWQSLRHDLEQCENPFVKAIDFFDCLPTESIAVDPYNESTWPDPWLLIKENVYCRFLKTLGICYSLQLTDRFSTSDFEIHIGIDSQNNDLVYKIMIDNDSISSYNDEYVLNNKGSIESHSVITMPKIN
jgi:hypothetical protein